VTLYALLAGLCATAVLLVRSWWDRRKRAQAEQRADDEHRRADVATATAQANAIADKRETAAHVEAERAIPLPTSTGWEAVGEIDTARRKHDAERVVRGKIARKP
jgi:FtsZ-interacting cell division protein ZipA